MMRRVSQRTASVLLVSAMVSTMALAAFSAVLPASPAGAADAPAPWTVSVTPNKNVTDGSLVSINLRTPEDHRIYSARAQVCRLGVEYARSTTSRPNEDFLPGGLNCPSIPISSSADIGTVDSTTFNTAVTPEGETFTIYVGTGVVEWISDVDSSNQTLTCDYEHPCAMVVEVRGVNASGATEWIPYVQELKYAADDPITGCGGPAEGMVATGGSERISGAWVDLTLDQCHLEGAQAGAATSASFAGEKDSMEAFSANSLDIAYSAVGYDSAVGFGTGTEAEPLTTRPSVAVPVNLNAVVVAVGNGRFGANEHKVPYSNVRMTLDQVTQLFSGGPFQFTDGWIEGFTALNPQFRETGVYANTSPIKVGASSAADAQSYFFTNFLKTHRPSLWKVPDTPTFGPERGLTRGVDASLPLATPSYGGVLDFYSGEPLLKKTIRALGSDSFGGVWVMTDLVTATRLGMAVVSIENNNGKFVSPTQESMGAAVATMTSTDDGRRMPDPNATVAADAVQPYPLTYVEYAIAPTQKLIDSKCKARKTSQDLMHSWLAYMTGDGQEKLPEGYGRLTDDLRQVATTAIEKVGSEYPDCLAPEKPLTPNGSGDPVSGAGGSLSGGTYRPTGGAAGAVTTGGAAQTGANDVPAAEMPEFSSRPAASTAAAFGGLLAVLMLLGAMVLATTGRLPSISAIRSRFGATR
jgi:hypothetical protein